MFGQKGALLVAALVALVAVVPGCGGGDDDDGLTKAQLVKQGDKICEEMNNQYNTEVEAFIREKGEAANQSPVKLQAELYEELNVPLTKQLVGELDELSPEGDLEETYETLIANAESAVGEAEANPKGAIAKSPFEGVDKELREFGFKICSF